MGKTERRKKKVILKNVTRQSQIKSVTFAVFGFRANGKNFSNNFRAHQRHDEKAATTAVVFIKEQSPQATFMPP